MSLFSRSSKVSVIFDIGNGSIGAALVALPDAGEKNKQATIIYTYREPITFITNPTPQNLAVSMLRLLKSVSTHLQKNGFAYLARGLFGRQKIQNVYCVFAAPWSQSATSVIDIKKRRPTLVTQSMIEEIIASSALSAESVGPADTARTVIEKKIVSVNLNGYDIVEPIGKKATEIEITAFSSSVAAPIIKKTEEIIRSLFHFKDISFFSYALASWVASRNIFPAIGDFLFFDVSGEATEISIVIKGVLRTVESFPQGRAAVLRSIVADLAVSPDVALSYLTLVLRGGAEANLARRVKAISDNCLAAWQSECQAVLKKIQQKYSLPQAVFITVDDDVSPLFCQTIRSIHSPELSIPHSAFNLVYLDGDIFRNHNRYRTVLKPDPFLSLESVFLTRFPAENIGKGF
jgi:hypothetical protein